MSLSLFLDALVSGILQGGVLALLTVGLALIFGVMNVVNFGQAEFMILGMYGALVLWQLLSGIPSIVLALLMFPPVFIIGWVAYSAFVSKASGAGSRVGGALHAQLMVTLAFSILIQSALLMTFGATPKLLRRPGGSSAFTISGLTIDYPRLQAFALALLLGGVLVVLLERTTVGRQIRAAADSVEAAQYVGINVSRVYGVVFGIGVGLAAVGGGILVTYYPVQPFVGIDFIILMFAAILLGGLGNVKGALVGGFIIGIVQSVSQIIVPLQLAHISVLLVFLLTILYKPDGIFGSPQRV